MILGIGPNHAALPNADTRPPLAQWHDDCLAVAVLAASAYGVKGMIKLLKRGDVPPPEGDGPAAVLGALHAACHQDEAVRAALAKDLSTRYRGAVNKARGLSPDQLASEAARLPWPIPMVWACYNHPEPEARGLASRLAHGVVFRGVKALAARQSQDEPKARLASMARENNKLRDRISQLQAQVRTLERQAAARPAPAPAQPSGDAAAAKARARRLEQALAEEKRQRDQLQQDLAIWRGLALAAENSAQLCQAAACDHAPGREEPAQAKAEAGQRQCEGCDSQACHGGGQDCPLRGLKVAVIGGLDRLEGKYCKIISELGGEGLCHTGQVGGRPQRLRKIVNKADLVVFITSINSHNAMSLVKEECRRCSKRLCILRRTGAGSLQELLANMAA